MRLYRSGSWIEVNGKTYGKTSGFSYFLLSKVQLLQQNLTPEPHIFMRGPSSKLAFCLQSTF